MTIELNQSNLKDLNDTGETLIKGKAKIKLIKGDTDNWEPSTFLTIYIEITRKTLVTLLKEEVTIDDITLKLIK